MFSSQECSELSESYKESDLGMSLFAVISDTGLFRRCRLRKVIEGRHSRRKSVGVRSQMGLKADRQ